MRHVRIDPAEGPPEQCPADDSRLAGVDCGRPAGGAEAARAARDAAVAVRSAPPATIGEHQEAA
jgi:hypothetical protein